MSNLLERSELFATLAVEARSRLGSIARSRAIRAGEYLFLLGDRADSVFIVERGQVELCFPIMVGGALRDIPIETKGPGGTLGWSALVAPYRFTLSARAAEESVIVGFARHDLQELLLADPSSGYAFMRRVAEIVGQRLLVMQALWARELQRAVGGAGPSPHPHLKATPGEHP